ncbi:LacI family DNA-binding transcriptional regulator [Parapedobacter sp. ISTM3]|uniref:LacI family DNA-binding transcriptional regulator n=1 Tax=Parapedobacter sp. ISTM3 TaxID=2800130 RepID=UPI0019068E24|nr:LacI family DNA-binding transcriptional regulator [Parapedobacter sp. ISTM3]MBK1439543.1 LacI family DNA-binding transcriptional regulator [Parapedobacter sp. ISTM3]
MSTSNERKEVTIYDIAEALHISAATVSRGLKNHPAVKQATKDKIFAQAERMGYRFNTFARNLRTKRTYTIGVIVPRLNSMFMSDVIAGMEKVSNEAGYELIISQSLETMEKEMKNAVTMFNNRVDGLLVSLAYTTTGIDHFKRFMDKNIPLIFFDRVFEHPNCPNIVINNHKAAYELTSYLIHQGAKRIMHIAGNLNRNVYSQRFKGYKDALSDNGIQFQEDWLMVKNLSAEDGIHTAKHICALTERPDAIFVANDTCAVACMQELKRNGVHVPKDMLVAGFNNDPIATVVEPNLTTVNYRGHEMGEMAAKTLINLLNGSSEQHTAATIVLRHELIIRDSTQRE